MKPSSSIKYVSKNCIEYTDGKDLIKKLTNFIEHKND